MSDEKLVSLFLHLYEDVPDEDLLDALKMGNISANAFCTAVVILLDRMHEEIKQLKSEEF